MRLSRRLPTVLVMLAATGAAADEKPKVEELLAKHAAAIGDEPARKAAGGRVAKGQLNYIRKPMGNEDETQTFAARTTNITVPAVLASGGPRYLLDLRYGWKDYPFDRVVFDGKKVKNARAFSPGNYSVIAGLLRDNPWLLKSGLLAGPLTTAWALAEPGDRFEKLSYEGTKKVEGTTTHRLEVRLKSDPEHEITFYLDTETYRLVRTHIWIGPNGRRKLEEDFSDYKTVEGLTLPHTWEMRLDAPVDRWVFKLAQLSVASELPEEAFVVD